MSAQLPIRKQTAPVLRNLSILLYGMPKVGKTTQAAKFPQAVLLNCEPGGTDFVRGEHDILDISSLDHLAQLLPALIASDYRTVVLDGFTWLVNQAVRDQAKRNSTKDRRRIYADVTDHVSRILGDLLSGGKIVIATGHSRIVDSPDDTGVAPAQAGSDEKVEIRPDINPRLAEGIFGLFSIICYCFAAPGGGKMLTKPVDNAKRRILAGDRSGILPDIMPLDAAALMTALKNEAQKARPTAPDPQEAAAK